MDIGADFWGFVERIKGMDGGEAAPAPVARGLGFVPPRSGAAGA